jgi:restriction system protein
MPAQVPPYQDLLWPALQAVIELGGSASIVELDAGVVEREKFSPKVQAVLHGDGPSTEISTGWRGRESVSRAGRSALC